MKTTTQAGVALAGAFLLLTWSIGCAAPASASKLTSALHWRSVGPYLGGRVTSVTGVASEPGRFYATYAGGGVWQTDSYGKHWKEISAKDFKTANIGAIAVAPSNPKIIYVGAGDSAPRNTVLTAGGGTGGIYKSTDGGKSWTHLGLRKTNIISWIVVDPKNPDIVYAAALGHLFAPNPQRGVYKSADGGKTWKRVLYVNDKTGAIMLAMDPSNPQVLYAAMWQVSRRPWTLSSGGPGSGIYKTTDGGSNWTNITHNPGLPTGIFGKVGIAVAPSKPSVVYALIQASYKGAPGGLFRSENGGHTWNLVNDSMAITQRAFYYMRVYVGPKDANTIYLPNVGVYVSHDSGKTLHPLHPPHGDNHALWIDPKNPNILIEGNDGGATVSLDGGKKWSTEFNQPTGQFYHVNLDDQFPFHIYGAQQDRGSIESASAVRSGGIGGVWQTVVGGEMSWVVPKPGQPWISYGSGYYSKELKENRHIQQITNISPWPAYKFGVKGAKVKYRFGWWHHPVVTVTDHPNELLVGANVLFKTTDGGLHWKTISPDLTRNDKSKQQRSGGPISKDVTGEEMFDTISAIAISPLNGKHIWTGSDDGLVYVTRDGGTHWDQVRPPKLPKWSTISAIQLSHRHQGTAFVAASRYMWDDFHPYLYKTTDYGNHWTQITSGLPASEYVTSVVQDRNDPDLLFAGTSSTVYMSLDDGNHWQPLTLNLPAVRVTDVAIQGAQHSLVISTFGRAFWVLDNLQFVEQLASAKVADDHPYVFKPQQTWLVKRRTGGFGARTRTGNAGKNLSAGATVFFHLPSDYNGRTPVKLSFTTQDGKLIRTYTLPVKPEKTHVAKTVVLKKHEKPKKLHPGMNRFLWNLRYPNAVDINGIFNTSDGAAKPMGPEVLPGKYDVVLHYGHHTQRQSFVIKLDPRLDTTHAQLQQRFALQMRLYQALNQLDTTVNQAIDARDALKKATANSSNSGSDANKVLAQLEHGIDDVVDLKIQSSEGELVFPGRLRAHLSQIAEQVGRAFVAPTASMRQVADMYIAHERKAVKSLQANIHRAKETLK
jgi:photosystem II stability/assembly factor-like uncharacterized protein